MGERFDLDIFQFSSPGAGPRVTSNAHRTIQPKTTLSTTTIAGTQLSHWSIPSKRNTMHQPPLPMIIIDRVMLNAPIIPERNTPNLPPKPARELGTHLMPEQKVEQRPALLLAPPLKPRRMRDIDVQRPPARLRVRPHDGVRRLVAPRRARARGVLDPVLARLGHVGFRAGVDGAQAAERGLQTRGERVVREVLAGEEGVTADGGALARDEDGAHRRGGQVGRVGVPDAAEVVAFVRELEDLDDLRVALDAFDKRVFDRSAEAGGEGAEGGEGEGLVPEEDHLVVEQGLSDRPGRGGIVQTLQVHAADFGADAPGQPVDGDGAAGEPGLEQTPSY